MKSQIGKARRGYTTIEVRFDVKDSCWTLLFLLKKLSAIRPSLVSGKRVDDMYQLYAERHVIHD